MGGSRRDLAILGPATWTRSQNLVVGRAQMIFATQDAVNLQEEEEWAEVEREGNKGSKAGLER